jgi:O-antigen/teichoic acid export membrane protein
VLLPSSLLDALAAMLPLPLVAALFGSAAAGEFLLVQTLSAAPSALIGNSIADVFHARLAELSTDSPAARRALLLRVLRKLALLSAAVYVPAAALAPVVFPYLFGGPWSRAGVVFALLAPNALAGLVVSPVSRLLFVVNRPELKLIVDGLRLLVPLLTLTVLHRTGAGFLTCVAAYGIGSALAYALYLGLILYASGRARVAPVMAT